MQRWLTWTLLSALLLMPLLVGCESRRLKEEHAALTRQVDSLTQERNSLQAKAAEMERARVELSTRLDALAKENENLKKQLETLKPKGKKGTKKASAKATTKKKR